MRIFSSKSLVSGLRSYSQRMSTMEGDEALREKYSFKRITQKDGTNKKGIEKIVSLACKDQNEVKNGF
jgi:hypothetical protein